MENILTLDRHLKNTHLMMFIIMSFGTFSFTQELEAQELPWVEKGRLVSSNRMRAILKVSGILVTLIPDGSLVKKGETIATVDVGDLNEKIENAQDELDNNEQRHQFEHLRLRQTLSSANAQTQLYNMELKLAQSKLKEIKERYTDIERQVAEEQLKLSQLNHERALGVHERQRHLVEKGFSSKRSLEPLLIRTKSQALSVTNRERSILKMNQPPKPETLKEAEAKVIKWENEIQHAKSKLKRKCLSIELKLEELELMSQKTKKVLSNLKKLSHDQIVRAPQSGMILLSKRQDWSSGGRFRPLKIGGQAWERDTLATIVDPSQVEVHFNLHESDIDRVKVGQTISLQLPALNLKTLEGTVTYKSALGQDLKDLYEFGTISDQHLQSYFKVVVQVKQQDQRFLPGMTAVAVFNPQSSASSEVVHE